MLSPDLLKKVDAIFIRSRHRVTDVFSGEYESAFRGRGIEFEEFREYVPGDDIRQIDWNVTARMDKPFVKVFREEREQTLFFLVDASASLHFGKNRYKSEVAGEIAALLAFAAIKSNDKVGLIVFSDRIERFIPPKKGRAHVWNIIANILNHKSYDGKTDISGAMQFFLNVAHRRTIGILVSDLLDHGFEETLKLVGNRHDLIVVRILDILERQMPPGALMDFVDLESGANLSVDLNATRHRDEKHREKKFEPEIFFKKNRIDFLDLNSENDYADALQRFFIEREKKR